jgi:hypothetical protein
MVDVLVGPSVGDSVGPFVGDLADDKKQVLVAMGVPLAPAGHP